MRRLSAALLLLAVIGVAAFALLKDLSFDNAGIAFLGDSVTVGAAASSPSKDFVSLVTQDLDQRGIQEDARSFISLDPNTDLAAAARTMKKSRRFVIVEFGAHAILDDQLSADQFRQIYAGILDCVAGGDTIVVAGTIPWLNWSANPNLNSRGDQFSRIIAEEAAKRGIAVADLWSAMNLRPELISTPQDYTFTSSHKGDDFHPNDAGHAVIAQEYEKALAAELANPPHRPYAGHCP